AAGDACVQLCILGVDRRFDFRRVGGVRLQAVERNRGVESRSHAYGQLVDDAPAKAEADRAELAARIRQGFEPLSGGGEIRLHLDRVDLFEEGRALLVVARITSDRSETVRR